MLVLQDPVGLLLLNIKNCGLSTVSLLTATDQKLPKIIKR